MKKMSIENAKKLSKEEMKKIMAGSGNGYCGASCFSNSNCGAGSCPHCIYNPYNGGQLYCGF